MALSVQSSAPTSPLQVVNSAGGSIKGVVNASPGSFASDPTGGFFNSPMFTVNKPAAATAPKATTPAPAVSPVNAQAISDYNRSKTSSFNSINDAISQGGQGYNSSILDYLDSRSAQQNSINSDAVQNELSRQQGMQGILDMVGNGVKSSGAILAGKNAGSSSAGGAIAAAYGTLGRQQASGVGNQFAQGQDKINTEQGNLALADATQMRHSGEDKTNTINSIVNSARSQLAALNQSAQYASIPDRIDIEAKITQIKQQAMDALSGYDKTLSGGIAGQGPQSADATRAKATSLLSAGVAPESAFDYTTDAPAQFQDTGQFASSLPIFIAPKKNNR